MSTGGGKRGRPSNRRAVTHHLRRLADEVHDVRGVAEDGTVVSVTRAEALAEMLWIRALGGRLTVLVEETDDATNERRIVEREVAYVPEEWAIKVVLERNEGRVEDAPAEQTERTTAAERVDRLRKARINSYADGLDDGGGPDVDTEGDDGDGDG